MASLLDIRPEIKYKGYQCNDSPTHFYFCKLKYVFLRTVQEQT